MAFGKKCDWCGTKLVRATVRTDDKKGKPKRRRRTVWQCPTCHRTTG
jgi:hypothetical protein